VSKTIAILFAMLGFAVAFAASGSAQEAHGAFVGSWKVGSAGSDEVILIVTGMGATGTIEGRMEFPGLTSRRSDRPSTATSGSTAACSKAPA
jgi:hypothetical protein